MTVSLRLDESSSSGTTNKKASDKWMLVFVHFGGNYFIQRTLKEKDLQKSSIERFQMPSAAGSGSNKAVYNDSSWRRNNSIIEQVPEGCL